MKNKMKVQLWIAIEDRKPRENETIKQYKKRIAKEMKPFGWFLSSDKECLEKTFNQKELFYANVGDTVFSDGYCFLIQNREFDFGKNLLVCNVDFT